MKIIILIITNLRTRPKYEMCNEKKLPENDYYYCSVDAQLHVLLATEAATAADATESFDSNR